MSSDRAIVTGLREEDWRQIAVLKKRYDVKGDAGLFRIALDFLWGLAIISRGLDEPIDRRK